MEIVIENLLSQQNNKIIDIRPEHEFKRGNIEGSINVPEDEVLEMIKEFDKNDFICMVCATGNKTEYLVEELESLGYKNIYNLIGGYEAYMKLKLNEFLKEEGEKEESGRRSKDIERSIIKKFRKNIWRKFTAAINEYELIKDGDKIAVCISGGKDSMLMAKLFQELLKHGKKNFELVFLVMNPGYDDINYKTIVDNARLLDVPIVVFESSIYDIVAEDEKSPCYLCARMRRGHLYAKAKELGCNKIALGHHFDDVIETIVMGMLYGAQIQTMMPKLHSTNFEGMELIRPLYLVREDDIIHWAKYNELNFIRCACRLTDNCSISETGDKGSMRAEVKKLIRELAAKNPYIEKNIFRSVENVSLDTIIAYKKNGIKYSFLENYD